MRYIFKYDYFIISFFSLLLINLYMVYSSTYFTDYQMCIKELFFIFFSFTIAIFLYNIILNKDDNYYHRMRRFYILNMIIMFFGILISIALFVLPVSVVPYINGATRWIKTPFFNIAPIEIFKIGIIFIFTQILTSNTYTTVYNSKQLKVFLPFLFIFLILSLLIPIKQKDLGNFFLITSVFIFLIFILFNRLRLIFKLIGIFIFGISVFILTSTHRIERIKNWLYSATNSGDISSNYQVKQGLQHIHNSGFFGNGFGESIMKLGYIPDLHTDMIFTLLINETGILGFSIYYILLFYICFFIIYKSIQINNLYTIIYTLIVSLMILTQSFINLFGILGLIPLKGISVPFLSYGGSSMFFNIIIFTFAIILLKINSYKTPYQF